MNNKCFIITIDTEGDNLWAYKDGDVVQTNNASYIPRFQALCEKYGFKPVYLTNYEMISSDDFVQYIKPKVEAGLCEVGIHIHAWNNPPYYDLKGEYAGNPYLIEYPYNVMREKFKVTYDLICDRIGIPPVSHRAGRWAMNDDYFNLLKEFNIKVDCSHTPGINWKSCRGRTVSGGSNYSTVPCGVHDINGILEVPVSIRKLHYASKGSLKHRAKVFIQGQETWLRPTTNSLSEMKHLIRKINGEGINYLEFMIHSSEFMPGGSPFFKTDSDVNGLFSTMDALFEYAKDKKYEGITLKEYPILKNA